MTPFSKLWAILFLPLTALYSVISALKNWMYEDGILKPAKVSVPVISVGNLTVGGTGKTPVVAFLANELTDRGLKVGIVSRGYGRISKGTVWVSKEGKILVNAIRGGDEPVELAAVVRNSTIVVGETRFEAATELLDQVKVDVILVDDGMQHRKIHRDVNIAVQDVPSASGWKFQLPSGPFRESWKNITRADAVIWTKWNDPAPINNFDQWKKNDHQPHFWAKFVPRSFYHVREKRDMVLTEISGETAIAFCGIGQPEHFKSDLQRLGLDIVRFQAFPDHHAYSKQDLLTILELYRTSKVKWIITTAKDYHRLAAAQTTNDFMSQLPCIYLKGHIHLESGMDDLMALLMNKIEKAKTQSVMN